jgi:hypothetical protein
VEFGEEFEPCMPDVRPEAIGEYLVEILKTAIGRGRCSLSMVPAGIV